MHSLANRNNHYKGYNRNKTVSKFTKQNQTQKQEILVHVISVLKITKYTTLVNRQKINEVMDALQKANQKMIILLNITDILTQHFRYYKICTFAYLRDCLTYMRQVATHMVDSVDIASTNILSMDIFLVKNSRVY